MNTDQPTARFVLVTGATGQQGGAVTQALLARGHRVRALTRNPHSVKAQALAAQGVEVVAGDFADQDSLVRAAQGVDTIFAMTTPFEKGVDAETAQGLQLLDAAKQASVGHFVYSSVGDADKATGIPHFDSKYAVEEAIVASGVPYTILGPVFFMDNFLQPWITPGLAQGQLSLAMPGDRPLQQVSLVTIGTFAAALIERRDLVFGQRFDLAGDELTNHAVATVLSHTLGRPIAYQGFPPAAMRAHSEDMAIMFEWFDTVGYSSDISGLQEAFPEVEWQTFAQWADAAKETLLAALEPAVVS